MPPFPLPYQYTLTASCLDGSNYSSEAAIPTATTDSENRLEVMQGGAEGKNNTTMKHMILENKNTTTIFVNGTQGFKSAVIDQLGKDWIHNARDLGKELISFEIPDTIGLQGLKEQIGATVLTVYHVKFFTELPDKTIPYEHLPFTPGAPIKMSIWVNQGSELRADRNSGQDHE